jgi:hypothetical protein
VLAAYFDAARFWRDIGHVMALGLDDLALHLRHAERIAKAERNAT